MADRFELANRFKQKYSEKIPIRNGDFAMQTFFYNKFDLNKQFIFTARC